MRIRFALPIGGAFLATCLLLPGIALAHEQRDVGAYHFVVGFLNEPSIQDQMNGIDLTITTTAGKKPVTGAEKTLKAEVIAGGSARVMPLPLVARYGMPGKYAAYFIPTLAGAYTFHISGAINGDKIDQRFESGPGRFNDVESAQALQFPVKLSDPATSQDQLAAAQSTAGQGRALGIAGIVVGAAGLILGAVALTRRPKGV